MNIQSSAQSVASIPTWFGEITLLVHHLQHQGVLAAIEEQVRFARHRFGRYEVIDFIVVLFGYAISGERTLEAFYEQIQRMSQARSCRSLDATVCRCVQYSIAFSPPLTTRLWLAGTVSASRDKGLADALMQHVRRSAQTLRPLLVSTDGWAAYPNSIRHAFPEQVEQLAGVGRASLEVWPHLHIGTVIKRTEQKRVVEITRHMAHGLLEQAERLLQRSGGGNVLTTACIERLNGTFRERLASLTRKSRYAASRIGAVHTGMYLVGCTSNFCCAHQDLSKAAHWGKACTPAMASAVTDHIWSVCELLPYKVVPAPWIEPKRRGRPKKQPEQTVIPTQSQNLRPRVRPLVPLRKGVLCSTTS